MRFLTALVALAMAFSAAHAQLAPPAAPPSPPAQPAQPDERVLLSHEHYRTREGALVHAPAQSRGDAAPDGASARCRDGSWSFSQHRRGTCSHHGGVGQWR